MTLGPPDQPKLETTAVNRKRTLEIRVQNLNYVENFLLVVNI